MAEAEPADTTLLDAALLRLDTAVAVEAVVLRKALLCSASMGTPGSRFSAT
jgi:hypothetical protein